MDDAFIVPGDVATTRALFKQVTELEALFGVAAEIAYAPNVPDSLQGGEKPAWAFAFTAKAGVDASATRYLLRIVVARTASSLFLWLHHQQVARVIGVFESVVDFDQRWLSKHILVDVPAADNAKTHSDQTGTSVAPTS